jgi:hypothetical protein
MRRISRFAALGALLAGLAVPGTAWADSGSITNLQGVAPGQVRATFTATSTFCGASGYCGFFAYARMVTPEEACDVGAGRAVWVSDDVSEGTGTQSGTETFSVTGGPVRLCLFVVQPEGREFPVAELMLDPNNLPAAATQTAPSVNQPVVRRARRLTLRQTRTRVNRALRTRYKRAYTRGTAKRRSCRRVSRTQLRCRVSWRYKRFRYRGTVRVTSTVSGLRHRINVRRTRIR